MKKLLFLIPFILFYSCDELCVQGNLSSVEEIIVLDDYINFEHSYSGTVHLVHGEPKIKIITDSNIYPYLLFSVNNRSLELKTQNNSCINPKIFDITLYSPDFSILKSNGSANWNSDELQINPKIISNGSGNITLKGKSDFQEIVINGSGNVILKSMPTTNTKATINGSGNCELFVSNNAECFINGSGNIKITGIEGELKITISGSGNLYYSGNPSKLIEVRHGSGKVIKILS